jgi:hypothetical protein
LDWYHECLSDHPRCQPTGASQEWYPTRLLDIGADMGSKVRLCITAEETPEGPYVTLSHCWGTVDILKLSGTNLANFQTGISLNALPKSFVEAIEIARRLKIRYLWIDSLCILQDSTTDWHDESAMMQNVYRYSRLNIAATASHNSDGGLFRLRNSIDLAPCTVRSSWNDVKSNEFVVLESDLWISQLRSAPLNHRAWVLQERVLSPRVLHFGETQLLWECHEKDACEMYPQGIPSLLQNTLTNIKGIDPILDGSKLRILSGQDTDPKYDGYHLWARIVKAYTECNLTKPNDKLVAIHGLSKTFETILNDTYIAGLWKRFLSGQLMWLAAERKRKDDQPLQRPTEYRAPSWSWASVEGTVFPGPTHGSTMLFNVLEASVDAMENGQVTGGEVRIEGKIIHAEIRPPKLRRRAAIDLQIAGHKVSPPFHPDEEISKDLKDAFILPGQRSSNGYVSCLLLRPVQGGEQGWYQRFGSLTADEKTYDIIEEALNNSTNSSSFYCKGNEGTIVLV